MWQSPSRFCGLSVDGVETSVNVISNSPSQDYTHPDDHTLLNDVTPGFKPLISRKKVYLRSPVLAKRVFAENQLRLMLRNCGVELIFHPLTVLNQIQVSFVIGQ